MTGHAVVSRVADTVSRTRSATSRASRRRSARLVADGVTAAHLGLYFYAMGHLAPGLGGVGVSVVNDLIGQFLRPALGPLSFMPVARLQLGPLTYLFSMNTVWLRAVGTRRVEPRAHLSGLDTTDGLWYRRIVGGHPRERSRRAFRDGVLWSGRADRARHPGLGSAPDGISVFPPNRQGALGREPAARRPPGQPLTPLRTHA